MFFSLSCRRIDVHAIAGLDRRLARVKTPLRNVFITSCDLHVGGDDRVETDLLDAIGGEVNTRAVLCLVCEAGGVDEVTGLGAIVPLAARAGDSLLIRLIENDAAFGDDSVLCFVNRDLVSLKTISADANVDVAFVDERCARFQDPTRSALIEVTVISSVATPCTPPCVGGRRCTG